MACLVESAAVFGLDITKWIALSNVHDRIISFVIFFAREFSFTLGFVLLGYGAVLIVYVYGLFPHERRQMDGWRPAGLYVLRTKSLAVVRQHSQITANRTKIFNYGQSHERAQQKVVPSIKYWILKIKWGKCVWPAQSNGRNAFTILKKLDTKMNTITQTHTHTHASPCTEYMIGSHCLPESNR